MTASGLSLLSKAHGCLAGLALGDALGLPTEMLEPETIAEWYGEIRGLTTIDPRHPHHRLPRGSVSDDTDQALIIAELLAEDGRVEPRRLGERLLEWSETPRVRENNFMGRATRQALAALAAGAAVETAGRGETIGAAMRIAPVALACSSREQLVPEVLNACMPTHYTRPAISGAMAVAFGVWAALEPGATMDQRHRRRGRGRARGRQTRRLGVGAAAGPPFGLGGRGRARHEPAGGSALRLRGGRRRRGALGAGDVGLLAGTGRRRQPDDRPALRGQLRRRHRHSGRHRRGPVRCAVRRGCAGRRRCSPRWSGSMGWTWLRWRPG